MKKRTASSGLVKDIIIVVIGIAIIWIGLRVAFGTENPFYVVSSGSMIPNLNIFDVIVVQGNAPFDHVKIGDIIVFNRPSDHDKVIVHRVAEILSKDPLEIRTKGDANPGSIPGTDFPIAKQDYIGKVVYVIPKIGYITRILTPPINYIIIAVIVGIMIVKQLGKSKSQPVLSEKSAEDHDVGNNSSEFGKLSDDHIDIGNNSSEFGKLSDDEYSKSPDISDDKDLKRD